MRLKDIDLARGFTVFIMAPVHTVLMYSTAEVKLGPIGQILGFLAEGPGAPLFMILMGISFSLSSRTSLEKASARAASLAGLAFLLNTLKFILPLYLGIIPVRLLVDYGIHPGRAAYGELFGLVDILQLAAISIVVLSLVNHCGWRWLAIIVLGLAIALISPALWQLPYSGHWWSYFCTLLWGKVPRAFFPVFPWLIFPLAGLAIGWTIKEGKNLTRTCLFTGLGFLLLGAVGHFLPPLPPSIDFYHLGPSDLCLHLGVALVWLSLCGVCVRWIPDNFLFHGLYYLSRHITRIYILQWVIIFWMMGWAGYSRLATVPTLVWMVSINLLVIGSSWLWDRLSPSLAQGTFHFRLSHSQNPGHAKG